VVTGSLCPHPSGGQLDVNSYNTSLGRLNHPISKLPNTSALMKLAEYQVSISPYTHLNEADGCMAGVSNPVFNKVAD
jgi:hypothetical protein